ncbi:MAG TPA: lysophospholipid acyltransferase family protein [Bryobacteraceae bacterium]|nr:lysophospholipid acyltransferase family protein [Bryobacteraceae bacterium]
MLNIVRSSWIWAATAGLVLLWVPLLAATRLIDRDPLRLRTARLFRLLGEMVAKVNPWRLTITGREQIRPEQVYVVVCNHQSLADIPLVSHLRLDAKWLAKAELLTFPVFGWMMRMAGDVGVNRKDRRKAAQALLQCARLLAQGVSVVFFPEGTRSKDGTLLPFNDGPFQLAKRENVPVLPLVVNGTGTALPRNTWLFGPEQAISLSVLPPVLPAEVAGEVADLREAVRSRMVEELERLRERPAAWENLVTGFHESA